MQNNYDLVAIDGSFGEGGGQILRTALLLSLATGKPFEISNIRAKRPKPGLLHQHLATVHAFKKTTTSTVLGDQLGSTKMKFIPGKVSTDKVRIDVGTAGSITLILTTLLPALSLAGSGMAVTVTGGTDTKWSPTYDYFSNVILSLYHKLGIEAYSRVVRRGYYPAGGGEVFAEVRSTERVTQLKSIKGYANEAEGRSVCSNLPISVAKRQAEYARKLLEENGVKVRCIEVRKEDAVSPGTALAVWYVDVESGIFVGADSVGERGVLAEEIGRRAARGFINSRVAPLDTHIADVAIPLLALAEGNSEIAFPEVTGHIRSNIYTTELFTKRKFLLTKGTESVKLSVF